MTVQTPLYAVPFGAVGEYLSDSYSIITVKKLKAFFSGVPLHKFKTHRFNPMGLKFIIKVFGSGFGRKPFFRKVSPDNRL